MIHPSDTSPSIPGHDFRDGLERLTVLKALHALLHPLGKITVTVQSHSEPTMGLAWLHLTGLLLEWGRGDELLNSFEVDSSRAFDDDELPEAVPTDDPPPEPERRGRGRPRITPEEKERRLNERKQAIEQATKEKKEKKGNRAAHPVELIVDGPRTRPPVNYKEMAEGLGELDAPTARETLDTPPVEALEMSESLTKHLTHAKDAITAKLLKHLAGFLSLSDEAMLLLSVVLNPAVRKLKVKAMTPELKTYFAEGRSVGLAVLKRMLEEQLTNEGLLEADDCSVAKGQKGAKMQLGADMTSRYACSDDEADDLALADSILYDFGSAAFDSAHTNSMVWWKYRDIALRRVAAPYLAIQASSAASERLFSVAGYVGRSRRGALLDFRLEAQTLMRWNSGMVMDYFRERRKAYEAKFVRVLDD